MKEEPQQVSKAEFARMRGCSPPYISKLVKRGVVKILENGKVDVVASVRAIENSADPSKEYMGEVNDRQRKKNGSKNGKPHKPAAQTPFMLVRTQRETAEAKLALLEFDRESGRSILIEDVVKEVSAEYAKVRTRLLAIPSECAPAAHRCKTVLEVEARIREAVNDALEELTQDADRQPPSRH